MLEDAAAYDDAIAFLDTLPRPARARALRRYGKVRLHYLARCHGLRMHVRSALLQGAALNPQHLEVEKAVVMVVEVEGALT